MNILSIKYLIRSARTQDGSADTVLKLYLSAVLVLTDQTALTDRHDLKGAVHMERKKNSLPFDRRSQFNDNRDSYLDENGNYVYTRWVKRDNGKWEREIENIIPLTAENMEIIIMLDQNDYDYDLLNRYVKENDDYLIRNQQKKSANNGWRCRDTFGTDPLNNIADPAGDIFSQMFPDDEISDSRVREMEEFVRSKLTEDQQNLLFSHFGDCKFLEDFRCEEEKITGKKVTKQAIHNRWDGIINKACKQFGVKKPEQKYKNTDQ